MNSGIVRLIVAASIVTPNLVWAQSFRVLSREVYDSTGSGIDKSLAVASQKGLGTLVAGTSYKAIVGDDMTLVHYTDKGRRDWALEDRVSGVSERALDVAIGPDNIFRVLSVKWSGPNQGFTLYKVSPTGTVLAQTWVPNTTVSTSYFGDPKLSVGPSGECYAFGMKSAMSHLVKFNPDGTLGYDLSWSIPNLVETGDVMVLPSGQVVTVHLESGRGYITRKYTAQGTMLWENQYYGPHGSCLGEGLLGRQANGDIMVGASPESSFGVPQSVVYRLNGSTGALIWQKPYSTVPSQDFEATHLVVDETGTTYLNGFNVAGGPSTKILKYSSAGVLQATKSTTGSGGRTATGLTLGPLGLTQWNYVSGVAYLTLLDLKLETKASLSVAGEQYTDVTTTKTGVLVTGQVNSDLLMQLLAP